MACRANGYGDKSMTYYLWGGNAFVVSAQDNYHVVKYAIGDDPHFNGWRNQYQQNQTAFVLDWPAAPHPPLPIHVAACDDVGGMDLNRNGKVCAVGDYALAYLVKWSQLNQTGPFLCGHCRNRHPLAALRQTQVPSCPTRQNGVPALRAAARQLAPWQNAVLLHNLQNLWPFIPW
jgi:hypothetical protein